MKTASKVLLTIVTVFTGLIFALGLASLILDLCLSLLVVNVEAGFDIFILIAKNRVYDYLMQQAEVAEWLRNLDTAFDIIEIAYILLSAALTLITIVITAVSTLAVTIVDGVIFILSLIGVRKLEKSKTRKERVFTAVVAFIIGALYLPLYETVLYLIISIISITGGILTLCIPNPKVKKVVKKAVPAT